MPEHDAELWMELYAMHVPAGDHPYTEREARATLRSAFGRPAREPAKGNQHSHNGHDEGHALNAINYLHPEHEDSNNAFNACGDESTKTPEPDPGMCYGLAGDIVGAIADETEASPVALLMHFLVSIAMPPGAIAVS
jgi:hypothetical protein